MKYILTLIAESITILLIVLILLGNNDIIPVKNIINSQTYYINYIYIILTVWVAAVVETTLIFLTINISKETKKISAYKKQYEKNAVEYAEKDDVIKALENKVKTLETALNNVLENKE